MSQLQVTGEAKIRDIQGPVVANSGVITALNGAANQYVRGDGTLASFPTSGGGGSSVSYYLNGSVNQGTFGGSTYYQMSKNAIVGTGTNFSASANGLIAQFITDANDPDVVSIPSGNWNVEFFMNVSASSGALASFYVEFYKYNGSTFTLLATNVATPEQLTNTTTVDAYYTSVAMPLSTMAVTDRLAIRIFVNVAGKTVTLYTEDNRLCEVVTTFSKGLASLNNLTDQSQYLTTGTSGTNFAIVSSGDTHTFNLPVASATNTGKLSNTDWSTFNNKQAALSFTAPLVNTSNTISIPAATSLVDGYLDNLDWVNFNTAYNDSIISAAVTGTTTKTLTLNQQDGGTITASWTDINTDAVTSVFGRTGAVVAASGDYTTTQVTEGTNLYYTDARSRGALSFTAGSGAYNSTTGVITIPTNTNQLTNGASFITLGSLSGGTGISYNNTTGVITSTITQYTDALARASLSFVAGSGAYNSTTGVITIPTNNNQIANGAGYITSSALTSYVPYTGATTNVNLGNNDFTALGISGIAIEAKLNGTGSSPLILRTGTSGYSYGNDSISLISSPTSANTLTIVSDVSSVTKIAQIGLGSLTATRTFTLPNASGTLALTSQLTGGTVTSVGLSSATSGVTIGSSPITTSGTITLSIATASGSQNGLLSSTDWTTFNGKQAALTNPITGTGTRTINYLPIFSGSDTTIANSAITDNGTTVTLISRALSGTSATFSSTTTATAFIPSGSTIPTNGMYLSAANTLNFATNSANRFTIASDGIATFGTDLYVNRNIYVNNAEGGVYSDFYGRNSTSTSTPLAFLYGSAGTVTWNNGGTKMTLTSGGALQLVSSISATSATFSGFGINATPTSGGTNVSYGRFLNTGADFYIGVEGSTAGGFFTGSSAYAGVFYSGTAQEFIINGVRRLQIATSGAATFSSTVRVEGSYLQIANATNPSLYINNTSVQWQTYVKSNNNYAISDAVRDVLTLGYNGSASFFQGCNVGIGTSSPSGKFVVVGANANTFLNIDNVGGGEIYIGSNSFQSFQTAGSERMRINSSGRVFINCTSTSYSEMLRVYSSTGYTITSSRTGTGSEGHMVFENGNGAVGTIFTNGSSTSYNTSSDYRLKQDLKDYNGLDLVSAIKTYDYEWKTDETRAFGVIAHELQEVLPYAVSGEKDGEQMQGVDYSKIVPILIKSIQELQAKIVTLESKIN